MKPINMKKGVCHSLSISESEIIYDNLEKLSNDQETGELDLVNAAALFCFSRSGRNLSHSLDSFKRISELAENRNAETTEICTCETDLCDPTKAPTVMIPTGISRNTHVIIKVQFIINQMSFSNMLSVISIAFVRESNNKPGM